MLIPPFKKYMHQFEFHTVYFASDVFGMSPNGFLMKDSNRWNVIYKYRDYVINY